MPQKWFSCPDPNAPGRDEEGRVGIEACLAHAQADPERACDWTFPVLNYLIQIERDYLSPTAVQRCGREVFLKNAADYAVDPKKAWVRARGTLQHAALEKYPEGLTEVTAQRTITIEGITYTLKGTADVLLIEQRTIRDWKTVESIEKVLKYGALPKADHVEQLSVYAWLFSEPEHVWVRGEEILPTPRWEFDRGEVIYIDPKDHARYNFELWDTEQVIAMMTARLPIVARMMSQGQSVYAWRQGGGTGSAPPEMLEGIPGVLPREEQWRCGYCDVRRECSILARREGVEPPNPNRRRTSKKVQKGDTTDGK